MSAPQENLFVLPDVKGMNAVGLMKMMKALTVAMKTVTTELEIKSKKPVKVKQPKQAKEDKEAKVKGPTPPHLMKNNAWVAYVKTYARENGWEAFRIHQKEGVVEVAASVLRDGLHVHEATGKGMAPKEAMSYAKHLWSVKTGSGEHEEIFEAFEAQYGKQASSEHEASASEEEPEEVASASAAASVSTPVKAKKVVAQKAPLKAKANAKANPKAVEWEAPAPGNVKAWGHEGETYLRDSENRVWHAIQGGEVGAWKGIYNPLTDEIEEAEEPLYEDE
jgi:hypothetical protein